jgi:hypothetical protein
MKAWMLGLALAVHASCAYADCSSREKDIYPLTEAARHSSITVRDFSDKAYALLLQCNASEREHEYV